MARYLLLYRADPEAMAAMPEPTPEQAEEMNAAWNAWAQQVGAGLLDFGAPTAAVSEGADRSVGGSTLLEADDADAVYRNNREATATARTVRWGARSTSTS